MLALVLTLTWACITVISTSSRGAMLPGFTIGKHKGSPQFLLSDGCAAMAVASDRFTAPQRAHAPSLSVR